jgi:geranylgeranyl reductase family protein
VTTTPIPARTEVLVVGAGPAGSAAAAWAAQNGSDVVLLDAAVFPRDKTCGDGLTPRAIGELERLGLGEWVRAHTVNHGLRAHGFGQTLLLPWPGGSLPAYGSAVARTELDDHLRTTAIKAGAVGIDGARAVDVRRDNGRVEAVVVRRPSSGSGQAEEVEIACDHLVVADGVRSPLGKKLGREWHRDTVYGVAARAYVDSERSDDPWISSHLELRGPSAGSGTGGKGSAAKGEILSGYGWIFPLGDGQVNIGVGTLATARRPAEMALRPLMEFYADERRDEFRLHGDLRAPTSALLPMGGAISNVAGPNWALIGDAAACVNPLNGEGIDYGLESGRLVADLIEDGADLASAWPAVLREHYGEAFSIARRLAGLVTVPRLLPALGPAGMRSDWLMTLALRWMGNLVTDEDRDRAARVWRWAGRNSVRLDARPPFD